MKAEILGSMRRFLCAWLAFAAALARPVLAQRPAASTDSIDAGWPRQILSGTTTFSVYQPQVDSWKGNRLAVRAAVAVRDSNDAQPEFGVVWLTARTDVDKMTRLVYIQDLQALVIRDGPPQVMTLDPDSTVRYTTVTISRDYGSWVEVTGGVARGATIVLNPPDGLLAGQRVRAVPSTARSGG